MAGIARHLRLTIDGETHDITTNPGDYLAWIDECNGGVQPTSDAEFEYRDLLWLAWHAAARLHLTDLEADEFLAHGLDDLDTDVRPTRGTVHRR